MKTKAFTFKNDFHQTEVVLVAVESFKGGDWWLTKDQVKSISDALCGKRGCECGGYDTDKYELIRIWKSGYWRIREK